MRVCSGAQILIWKHLRRSHNCTFSLELWHTSKQKCAVARTSTMNLYSHLCINVNIRNVYAPSERVNIDTATFYIFCLESIRRLFVKICLHKKQAIQARVVVAGKLARIFLFHCTRLLVWAAVNSNSNAAFFADNCVRALERWVNMF